MGKQGKVVNKKMGDIEKLAELRKEVKALKAEVKELTIHNKFLIDRLEIWAERNFQLRSKPLNYSIDEKVELVERSI